MVRGLSPDITRKKPHVFNEEPVEGVPFNLMENMFNKRNNSENNETSHIESAFPWTPTSVKLSNRKLLSQAFKIALFIHDFWLIDIFEKESWEIIPVDRLKKYPVFEHKRSTIFFEEIFEDIARSTNLLITYKDINSYATSKNDLNQANQYVLDIPTDVKEIDSDLEEEYRQIVKMREKAKEEYLTQYAREKGTKVDTLIEKTYYKYHRIAMKNDATLYFGSMLNTYILQKLHDICTYTDEYIVMSQNHKMDLSLPRKGTKWIEYLNVAWYKHFLIHETGLGKRTGADILSMEKYDSYELYIYEQLNNVITKKYLEAKSIKRDKGVKRKKSLLPFLNADE